MWSDLGGIFLRSDVIQNRNKKWHGLRRNLIEMGPGKESYGEMVLDSKVSR